MLPMSGREETSLESAIAELADSLASRDGGPLPRGLLDVRTGPSDEEESARQLGDFVFQVWQHLCRVPDKVKVGPLKDLAKEAASLDGASTQVRTALEYLVLWCDVDEYLQGNCLREATCQRLATSESHLIALDAAIGRRSSEMTTAYGTLMLEGFLASLRDRQEAVRCFQDAQREDPTFAVAHHLDRSASTYLTDQMLSSSSMEIEKRKKEFLRGVEEIGVPAAGTGGRHRLVFSCDPSYLSAFFPYWASTLGCFGERDVCLHFSLIGARGETMAAFEHAQDVIRAVARLRGTGWDEIAASLSFSTAPVPEYVEDQATFSACARYLLAAEMASLEEGGGQTVIVDIDMVMRQDPREYLSKLEKIQSDRLAVTMKKGMAALVPARRHLAGTFAVPAGDLGSQTMRDIEEYIYVGLSRADPWTLDQNAITYATEQVERRWGADAVVDLDDFGEPFVQMPINRLYKKAQVAGP